MKHRIDPKVDCVFKALLGREDNHPLLINFLNAFLLSDLGQPITEVKVLNPYVDQEFIGDKLGIVDVKACDSKQRLHQIEIQLLIKPWLRERIAYNWAKLVAQQLHEGDDYERVRPTYSIWLLDANLVSDNIVTHRYKLRDENARPLGDHGGIWLLELNKFAADTPIQTDDERWLKFFREGEQLDDEHLPDWMQTNVMRKAMDTLRVFSEKEREYDRYERRQEFLRCVRSDEVRMQRAEQGREEAEKGREEAEKGREEAERGREEAEKGREESEKREAQLLAELERLRRGVR